MLAHTRPCKPICHLLVIQEKPKRDILRLGLRTYPKRTTNKQIQQLQPFKYYSSLGKKKPPKHKAREVFTGEEVKLFSLNPS